MRREEKVKITQLLQLAGATKTSFYVIPTKPRTFPFPQLEVTIRVSVPTLFLILAQSLLPQNAVNDFGVILDEPFDL